MNARDEDLKPSPAISDRQDAARRACIERTVRADVRALARYPVATADGFIKLDAMENPYGLPDALRERLGQTLAQVSLNRYPDGDATQAKHALRAALRLSPDVGLMLGNGSDELIQILTAAATTPDAVVIAPEPSFVMYRRNALVAHARFVGIPLRDDFSLDVRALEQAIARESPALVWLAFPNNPTGNLFDAGDVERIIRASPSLVVVDEAYYAFANDSFLPRVLEFPNLAVVRTVSKIGLAGLRAGYVAAHPDWIEQLEKVRPPYNVNSLTQAALPLMLAHSDALADQAASIRAERTRLSAALARLPGVRVFATQTNFVLVRVPDAAAWFATLRDARILVKNLDGWHPLLANCLRITVGTPAENDAVVAALTARYER
ncbi:MAG TPA: histidinol-phosphate transaminase [Casimicrobiaceae bacterium]|nr:histidinol-phosphate transaminase [Casimicrobiaceae bacterium]